MHNLPKMLNLTPTKRVELLHIANKRDIASSEKFTCGMRADELQVAMREVRTLLNKGGVVAIVTPQQYEVFKWLVRECALHANYLHPKMRADFKALLANVFGE